MTLLPHYVSLRMRGVMSCLLCLVALDGSLPESARALSFNLAFDSSTAAAPAGFTSAFNDAIQFYETHFTDPITINLQVGWGEVAGQALPPNALGESSASQPGFFQYGTIKSLLVADAKSAADITSVANLPASDPTGRRHVQDIQSAGQGAGNHDRRWFRAGWLGWLQQRRLIHLRPESSHGRRQGRFHRSCRA